jgi:hypothetical protein
MNSTQVWRFLGATRNADVTTAKGDPRVNSQNDLENSSFVDG